MNKDVANYLLGKSNITSVGIGTKVQDGKSTNQTAIICGATAKLAKADLSARDLVPSTIDGKFTDVVTVGVLKAPPTSPNRTQETTKRYRPAPGGVSIGHRDITAGTLGCYVRLDDGSEDHYVLSNNHVLANENLGTPGDPIYQPGPYDGGGPSDTLCKLAAFVPIDFGGDGDGGGDVPTCPVARLTVSVLSGLAKVLGSRYRVKAVIETANNLVDCAIAGPVAPIDVKNEILTIGPLAGIGTVGVGDPVKKHGRTTDFTQGTILQVDVTADVQYSAGNVARFEDQLLAGAMSQGGDSGSALVNEYDELVGLLFAGSDQVTIFNRIQNVMSALGLLL